MTKTDSPDRRLRLYEILASVLIFAILIAMPLFAYTFAVTDLIAVANFRNLQAKGELHLREKKEKKPKAQKKTVKTKAE